MEFEKLFQVYYMKVYNYLLVLTHQPHLAEELTQKTFFKALHSSSYRGESNVFTWLCSIAKNLYIDEIRYQKKFMEADNNQSDTINIEHIVEDEDMMFRIHRILHDLEDPYKEVFQLRVFGELSFDKIGLIFGKSENWARVTYHRSRLKIQERMETV